MNSLLISQTPFYIRYFVPLLALGMLYFIKSKGSSFASNGFDWMTVAFYITAVIAFPMYIRYAWLTLDRVYDSENSLIIERRGAKREIEYSDIKSIKIGDNDGGLSHAEIHLIRSIDWGSKFDFIPATNGKFSGKPIDRLYEVQEIVDNQEN